MQIIYIFHLDVHSANFLFHFIWKMFCLHWDLWLLEYSELIVMFIKSLWDDLVFHYIMHYPSESNHHGVGTLWSLSNTAACILQWLNDAQVVLWVQHEPRKDPSHQNATSTSLNHWYMTLIHTLLSSEFYFKRIYQKTLFLMCFIGVHGKNSLDLQWTGVAPELVFINCNPNASKLRVEV